MTKLPHGGDLQAASLAFGEPAGGWLDMSTGISPWSWPVPTLPEHIWRDLPYQEQNLRKAAAQYYRCAVEHVHIGPGSQAFIQSIPKAVAQGGAQGVVAVPAVGYQEHAAAWKNAGHQLFYYQSYAELLQALGQKKCQHAVLINPNNPTAEYYSQAQLLDVYQALPEQGILLLDEAFADVDGRNSLSAYTHLPNLFILRSIGKFFGLAGLRLGFCLSSDQGINQATQQWQPWGVSHPALWVGEKALQDTAWQQEQGRRLQAQSTALLKQLQRAYPQFKKSQWANTALFIRLQGCTESLFAIYQQWAQQGILLRYIPATEHSPQAYLRFGLPGGNRAKLQYFLAEKNQA